MEFNTKKENMMDWLQFDCQARQGDVFFRRIKKLPAGVMKADVVDGKYLVAHSETGHHHTMVADDVVLYYVDDPLVGYIEVKSPTPLVHERSFDTHESVLFEVGIYEIRRQREHTPEGFRRVVD